MTGQNIDLELVKQVQAGNRNAFNSLVLKYQYKVSKLVGRFVRDSAEVMDVSQEVFIKAYKALPNFRGDSAFYTWLYRIAINTAKNHIMAKTRRPPDTDVDVVDAEIQQRPKQVLKEKASPERMLLRDEITNTVYDVVENLPEDLRSAIILREMEGFSYQDISKLMNCPVGTVRSRIFRAREAIDKEVRPLIQR